MSALELLRHAFAFLRSDGLFIKPTLIQNGDILLETTTYITDTDEGKDEDCLRVHEDDLGLGGSCVCESITTGNWLVEDEAPTGQVPCPVCDRLTKPWTLRKRSYDAIIKVHDNKVSLANLQPHSNLKPMPKGMIEKILEHCNRTIKETP
jgi:hypothetical protein